MNEKEKCVLYAVIVLEFSIKFTYWLNRKYTLYSLHAVIQWQRIHTLSRYSQLKCLASNFTRRHIYASPVRLYIPGRL